MKGLTRVRKYRGMKTILAAPNLLKIENIALYSGEVRLVVKTRLPKSSCPSCGRHSVKAHSRYQRHLADLPWEGVAAKLALSVRKFFCSNLECRQKIFCERLPALAAPYAHKTIRLNELLTLLGRALGGRPGERMARGMGLQVSPDALIERVRRANVAQIGSVGVLGVDDFAFRRGKKYGTILIDHERRATVDLLPDHEAETLAQWLNARPGVEIVTRDRARACAEAINSGAPEAIQVADRWHIIRNLIEAMEKLLTRQHHLVRNAANPIIEIPQPTSLPPPDLESSPLEEATSLRTRFPGRLRKEVIERRDRLGALFQEVIELKQKGLSTDEIAKRVGKSPRTIRYWIQQGEYRERVRHRRSDLDIYFSYLAQRWGEGCHNAMQLRHELQGLGYRESYKSLNNYLHRQNYLRHRETPSSTVRPKPQGVRPARQARIETLIPTPSPRKALWMLLKPEELDEKERKMIDHLCHLSPEVKAAQELASSFIAMIRERRVERFDGWICQVVESHIPELKPFAGSLKQDQPAVVAALTNEWSNGMVEGQVNRLKLIKRTMYAGGQSRAY